MADVAVPTLHGLRVVDLGDACTRMAGRILADLGASVLRVVTARDATPPTVTATDRDALRDYCWSLGTLRVAVDDLGDPGVGELLRRSDLVITGTGAGAALDRGLAPEAVWLTVTPFGVSGPRSGWRAGDLGVMAASGNLYLSGYADRPPVICVEPVSEAHVGIEVVLAALIALSRGGARDVDVSAQESIVMANMGLADRARTTGQVLRRDGGRGGAGTTQVWTCRDGYVVLGLGGGPARQPTMNRLFDLMAADGIKSDDLASEPWSIQRWMAFTVEQQDEITRRIAAFFAARRASELQEIAYAERLMMAAVHSAAEVKASEQLIDRRYFATIEDVQAPDPTPTVPARFARIVERDGRTEMSPAPGAPQRAVSLEEAVAWFAPGHAGAPLGAVLDWSTTSFLEFGSSAAGPFTGRMFAEHGATVVRVESRTNPDFLRVIAATQDYGLDAAPMFDSINAGKLSVSIDMTRPEGRTIAKRLCCAFDVVSENFSPKTMRKLGLDYQSVAEHRPDLIMLSSCLSGQTGPNQFFPGFGGQGSALCGYTFLTGFPDRAPLGPAQAITDSLSPRFGALLLVALLARRARTGAGAYIDLSQVEASGWTLSPWFLAEDLLEPDTTRYGNRLRDLAAVPYGVFPSEGQDRWIAIAVRSDEEWARIADRLDARRPEWATLAGRQRDVDAVESALARWTARHTPPQCASLLQRMGIEAVPVADGLDSLLDSQLAVRDHYAPGVHPTLGERLYERSGYRIRGDKDGYRRPSPLVGEHTELVLGEFLGIGAIEVAALRESRVVG